jgi:hypothetical protein
MFPVHRSIYGLLVSIALAASAAPAWAVSTVGTVNGVGTGSVTAGGGLQPIGDGRFKISGREYQARFNADDSSGCFRGAMKVSEDAVLSVPHYAGSHEGTIEIAADAGTVQLRYWGVVNRYEGRGDWWLVKGTGGCADVAGSGAYASAFRTSDASYRLELQGRVNQGD